MEDNGVSIILVNYLKNCNTPSLGLLDLKDVPFTMLIGREKAKSTYSKECFMLKYVSYMIIDNIFQIHNFCKTMFILIKNHSLIIIIIIVFFKDGRTLLPRPPGHSARCSDTNHFHRRLQSLHT